MLTAVLMGACVDGKTVLSFPPFAHVPATIVYPFFMFKFALTVTSRYWVLCIFCHSLNCLKGQIAITLYSLTYHLMLAHANSMGFSSHV